MSFCSNFKTSMLVAKAHKYFIIFFILNPLFIQFSLSSSFSLSLLGFGYLGVSKNISIRENDYKEIGMRKQSMIGEFMVLLFLRSTFDRQKLPKHQIPKNPKPRPVDFFWVTVWFLSHWPLSFSLLSHWLPWPDLTWPATVQKLPLQLDLTLSPLDCG